MPIYDAEQVNETVSYFFKVVYVNHVRRRRKGKRVKEDEDETAER